MTENFWISASDPERAAEWTRIFGENCAPITTPPAMQNVILPYLGETNVYFLDLNALTPAQFERVVEHTVTRSHQDRDYVRQALRRDGMPIVARGTTIIVSEAPAAE